MTEENTDPEIPMTNWLSPSGAPSRKWRGASLTKLKMRADAVAALEFSISQLRGLARRAHEEYLVEVAEIINLPAADLELGSWACPESPTLLCIYNSSTDPMMDECLFCNQPAERK